MKKLITIITALFTLVIGAISISAQPARANRGNNKPVVKVKAPVYNESGRHRNNNANNGYYNRRGAYIYTTTKVVRKWRGKFLNTYQHKVFPNGRHTVKLIKSVKLHKRVYPVSVKYKSKIVMLGRHKYRIVYKITKFSNGQVQKIVHSRHRVGNRGYDNYQ